VAEQTRARGAHCCRLADGRGECAREVAARCDCDVVEPEPAAHGVEFGRDRVGGSVLGDAGLAVGAGDVRAARRAAGEAQALIGREPLVLLLSAQAAQIAGDGAAARTAFDQP